jgi:hypothetical protein
MEAAWPLLGGGGLGGKAGSGARDKNRAILRAGRADGLHFLSGGILEYCIRNKVERLKGNRPR